MNHRNEDRKISQGAKIKIKDKFLKKGSGKTNAQQKSLKRAGKIQIRDTEGRLIQFFFFFLPLSENANFSAARSLISLEVRARKSAEFHSDSMAQNRNKYQAGGGGRKQIRITHKLIIVLA